MLCFWIQWSTAKSIKVQTWSERVESDEEMQKLLTILRSFNEVSDGVDSSTPTVLVISSITIKAG